MDTYFQPERELIGNVEASLNLLLPAIQGYKLPEGSVEYLKGLKTMLLRMLSLTVSLMKVRCIR